SGVPLAANEVFLPHREEAPGVEHEGLEIITVGAPCRELRLTCGGADQHTPRSEAEGALKAADAQLDEDLSAHEIGQLRECRRVVERLVESVRTGHRVPLRSPRSFSAQFVNCCSRRGGAVLPAESRRSDEPWSHAATA